MSRDKRQTSSQVIKRIGRTIAFPLSLQKHGRVIEKLGWVFQIIGHVFWNKNLVKSIGQRETLGIFENLVCKN